MQKLLTVLAALAVIVTPAYAQSFDPDNGTGNVLWFGAKPTARQNDKITVRQSGIRANSMNKSRSMAWPTVAMSAEL